MQLMADQVGSLLIAVQSREYLVLVVRPCVGLCVYCMLVVVSSEVKINK
jgi:hypothetical protein